MDTLDRFSTDSSSLYSSEVASPISPASSNPNIQSPSSSGRSGCSSCQPHSLDLDFIDLSDEPPSEDNRLEVANIPIYDADGVSRPFHSLYHGTEHQGQRQLIIFIRHFYCGACQAYVKQLCDTITPSVYFSLPIPTTITVIGCGNPELIPTYGIKTHCPFRLYSDPSRRLYKIFGMTHSFKVGKRPSYISEPAPKTVIKSASQMLRAGPRRGFNGGIVTQIGGEFLFEDGEIIWCHRMRHLRDHAEMRVLKRVLETEDHSQTIRVPTASLPAASKHSPRQASAPEDHQGLKMVFDSPVTDLGGFDVPKARLARDLRWLTQ